MMVNQQGHRFVNETLARDAISEVAIDNGTL